jgi:hypothetical protein
MSATVSESFISRRFTLGRQAGQELIFDVIGEPDDATVKALVLATAPTSYDGLYRESADVDYVGGGVWKASVKYLGLEAENEYTFDTSGGTQKVTQGFSTVNSYAPAGLTAPDFKGAIGVSEDKVEGVDVTVPAFAFSETHRFLESAITPTYKRTLFLLTGRMNDATFKGFDAGECLFLGASGTARGDGYWSINYRFAGSPNQTGITVGDITGIDKLGWDYLWVRYADYVDLGAFALVKRPVAAYVERVVLPGDFSDLAIGT